MYFEPPSINLSGAQALDARARAALTFTVQPWLGGGDSDGDGIVDASDNCPSVSNPGQQNNDRDLIALPHPRFAFDDTTAINSDGTGDACDSDDDNDGLSDVSEIAGVTCGAFNVTPSPTNADSDGDLVLDGAECALGTNPMDAGSKPTVAQCVAGAGAASATTDSDGDVVKDYVEYCYYSSNTHSANTDGDGCGDAREVASVNGDMVVTSSDLGIVASSFGPSTGANYVADFDTNKDGNITSADLGFVASKFGACP
jgi:hypothetical protein